MRTKDRLVILLLVLAVTWPLDAAEARRRVPHEGWVLGFVLGNASSDFMVEGASESSGWAGGGRLMRGRVGYFPRPNLLFTGEYGVFRRAASDSTADASSAGWTAPTDRYVGTGTLSVHIFPLGHGPSMHAGLGFGRLSAQVGDAGSLFRQDSYGTVLVMGGGWEFSVAHDVSIALGAEFGRAEGTDGVSGNFFHLTMAFLLHLPEGLPKDWF